MSLVRKLDPLPPDKGRREEVAVTRTRSTTAVGLNAAASSRSSTSSHRIGIATGAPGSGRSE
jgi:hypothetical protein